MTCQTAQFLPEFDSYIELHRDTRLWFQAKGTREGGVPQQAEIGPSLDIYVKSLPRLVSISGFDIDKSRSRLLVLSVGYRYLPQANGAPATNRLEPVATLQIPVNTALLISDRNRADLDWQSGGFTWRYRNRLQVQKTLAVFGRHFIPYASAEVFYESRFEKWSTTALYGGFFLPVGTRVQLEPYYEHENNTGQPPNHQVNALGLVLNLFISR